MKRFSIEIGHFLVFKAVKFDEKFKLLVKKLMGRYKPNFYVDSRRNSKKNNLTRFSEKIGHFLVFKAVKYDEKFKLFVKKNYMGHY